MNIYISSSWKNREKVRECADLLRRSGHTVYDFTDPSCRKGVPEIPPEMFPEQFDPEKHEYVAYLDRPEWIDAVNANREALDECDAVVLLLPCGNDAHADWAYAVGRGKRSIIVGHPPAGERTPTHWWADEIVGSIESARDVINRWENWGGTMAEKIEHTLRRLVHGDREFSSHWMSRVREVADATCDELERVRENIDSQQRRLNDATHVLASMGINRRECRKCHRLTVVSGYCCWACGHDNSEENEKQS